MTDTTTRRVRVQLALGFLYAHNLHELPYPDSVEPVCVSCGHGQSAHHGPNGELHCGESSCGCPAFTERADG